ncbi:hypothetical protein SEVIR_1G251100v4 [Setaria viridis]|uniref:GRAM domain-containing protein n=1 Tax=Setaria viridis TaxID=4556 RepID=A0A4U6WDA7_SETVI|nr:putative GEM-like protein 8 [Setaria viridis]TKW40512.1 hypothetical protein SEVIR_1G251100v2 [Setaria viridis]
MEGSTTEGHVVGIPVNNRVYGIEEPDEFPIPVSSRAYGIEEPDLAYGIEEPEFLAEETPDHGGFPSSFQSSYDANRSTTADRPTSKHGRKGDNIARGIKEHVTLGPKLSDTVKGKLTLGAKILQAGGVEKMFRQWFSVDKNEKLLRSSQCYLSTTAGPIAGLLFVSTARVAFRSDRSLAVSSPRGDRARVPYKVTIPLRKMKAVRPSENKHRPEQKYVQLVTNDGFEFWFMGFVSYNRSLQHLEQAVAYAQQAQ